METDILNFEKVISNAVRNNPARACILAAVAGFSLGLGNARSVFKLALAGAAELLIEQQKENSHGRNKSN